MAGADLARLRAALDALPTGVITLDHKGHVEFWSAESSRLLGVSRRAAVGQPLDHCLDPAHPIMTLVREVLEGGRGRALHDLVLPHPSEGRELVLDVAVVPVEGDEEGAVVSLHDRTIGRELEALVEGRTRSDLYARLAAGIAHEIRNPLGGIQGAAELLEGKLEDERLRRYPRLIRDETKRVRALLDEFGEFARGGDLRPRLVNVHQVLDRTLELHVQTSVYPDIDVRREYDPSIPELEIDPDRLTQVFLNVAKNAIEAMQGDGVLLIRTRIDSLYSLRSPGSRTPSGRGHMVRVEFEDSGPGIPEEDLPYVFTPFFTRKGRGTGLGLAIAEHWVVRHGGRLEVGPGHAGGTRVRAILPSVSQHGSAADSTEGSPG